MLARATMNRRHFCVSLAFGFALRTHALSARARIAAPPEKPPELTRYVADFIVTTKFEDVPDNVLALGKSSILDGCGLAL